MINANKALNRLIKELKDSSPNLENSINNIYKEIGGNKQNILDDLASGKLNDEITNTLESVVSDLTPKYAQ